MKKIVKYILVILIIIANVTCSNSQNEDEQVIEMIKEFYVAHNTAWLEDVTVDVLGRKLDSLQERYCTTKLKVEAKRYFEQGFDLITNEQGMGIESNSLSVVKDSLKDNTYIVSYESLDSGASNNKIKVKVVVNVGVVKESGSYKINKIW